jgi:tRNA U34 5-carboxymethylaminomethyl modifying GTPase MnmE/TrmE
LSIAGKAFSAEFAESMTCRRIVKLRRSRQTHKAEPAELLALELHTALSLIGEMVGAVYTNDLLDHIFSRFCIGMWCFTESAKDIDCRLIFR